MTWGMALILSNIWFARAVESQFWMYVFGLFWLAVTVLGFLI